MKTTTQLLNIMKLLFWVIFIGLLINAGAILYSYVVSITNPDSATSFYSGIDVSSLYQKSFWQYSCFISFWATVAIMKAYLAYLVIQIVSTIDLQKPFSKKLADPLIKMSHVALGIGFIAVLAQAYTKYLTKSGFELIHQWGAGQFLFLAAIIFIIAHIFKRGVELQEENELQK